jgi:hypothetical protein
MRTGPSFSANGFLKASQRYDFASNPVLKQVGICDHAALTKHLSRYLSGIPELTLVSEAAEKLGLQAVLSGGSARAIVVAFLRDVKTQGKPDVEPKLSLFQMLEGSDVDVLIINAKGAVPDKDLQKLTASLNQISGANLVSKLPALERRLYAAEWDVVDGRSFEKLNKAFGGDTSSLFGIGLTVDGELLVYDPVDALGDILSGRMRYVPGKNPYDHEMVVTGKFDPALDGLRLIRMAGQMREVGVDMDDAANKALAKLGTEANRRLWESQARIEHSPNDKLGRRWAKYTKKIWVDHRDPSYARQLLQSSGYLQLMSKLGLGQHVLSELPNHRTKDVGLSLSPATISKLLEATAPVKEQLYCWQTTNLVAAMTSPMRSLFGADAGPCGPGLYLSTSKLQDGAFGNTLLAADASSSAVFLNVGHPDVEKVLQSMEPEPATPDWRSAAIRELCAAVGADGARLGNQVVVNNAAALGTMTIVEDLASSLVTQLRARALGDKTEQGVRALLASQGSAGIRELQHLMDTGRVSIADLFPAGTIGGGLFADVPTIEPEFASFLQKLVASPVGLTPGLVANVMAAVEYLRGDLPDSMRRQDT